jgi:hypothetical protein
MPPGWIALLVLCLVVFSLLVWSGHRRLADLAGVALLLGIVVASRAVRRR